MTTQTRRELDGDTFDTKAVTPYRNGSPAWMDLSTPDMDGTMRFYSDLFGWQFVDQGPDFGHYHFILSGSSVLGGLMSSVGMTCPSGGPIPTEWGVYLSVADLDEACAAAEKEGGHVVVSAMAVGDMGRMAMVIDAGGGVVGMWEPHSFAGFELPCTPGTQVWFEGMSLDFDAALTFYRNVFDWDVHWSSGGPDEDVRQDQRWRYVTHGAEETAEAGLGDARGVFADGEQSRWRIYLGTSNFDSNLRRIPELGGHVLDGPVDSPFGPLATIRDPQGGQFQLIGMADPSA